jgi:hypothetical protein
VAGIGVKGAGARRRAARTGGGLCWRGIVPIFLERAHDVLGVKGAGARRRAARAGGGFCWRGIVSIFLERADDVLGVEIVHWVLIEEVRCVEIVWYWLGAWTENIPVRHAKADRPFNFRIGGHR